MKGHSINTTKILNPFISKKIWGLEKKCFIWFLSKVEVIWIQSLFKIPFSVSQTIKTVGLMTGKWCYWEMIINSYENIIDIVLVYILCV